MSTITKMLRAGLIAVTATILAVITSIAVTHSGAISLSSGSPQDSHWTLMSS